MPISSLVYNCIIWIYAFEEAGIMWIWANQEGIFSSEDSSDFETQRNVCLFLDDPLRMVSPNLSDKSVDFLIAFTVILDFQQGYGTLNIKLIVEFGGSIIFPAILVEVSYIQVLLEF